MEFLEGETLLLEELEGRSRRSHVSAAYMSQAYAILNDADRAFAWLETAFEIRDPIIVRLKDPLWDSLRDDPRFTDLLRRIGLPP